MHQSLPDKSRDQMQDGTPTAARKEAILAPRHTLDITAATMSTPTSRYEHEPVKACIGRL